MPFGRAIGFFTAHAYIHVGLVYQARPSHPPEESLADVTAVCVVILQNVKKAVHMNIIMW